MAGILFDLFDQFTIGTLSDQNFAIDDDLCYASHDCVCPATAGY